MKIRVEKVDLPTLAVDGLIRSVGADLEPCTAVDRQIGSAAGAALLNRLQAFGEVPVGAALVTPGGGLPASFLIHLVIRSAEEPVTSAGIRRAFRNGLRQAGEWGLRTLAVPPLGIGAGNLESEVAARAMLDILSEHEAASALPEEIVIGVATEYEREAFAREAGRVQASEAGTRGDAQ